MMPKLAIIADDLTGALDAASPFAARGLRTVVAVGPEAVGGALGSEAEIIAVNTGSREIDAQAARERVARVLEVLPPGTRFFKKVDSRLKGNVEAELSVFPVKRLTVLPAIPEFGRIVEDGRIRGFGVDRPIEVAAVLGGLAGRADVPDTRTSAQMRAALEAGPDDGLLVGARGVADALAERIAGREPQPVCRLGRALTMVIGSRDPITLAQIEALKQHYERIRVLEAPNGSVSIKREEGDVAPLTLLQATPGQGEASMVEVADALARSLRRSCLDRRDGLLVSGGATAEIVLGALGIDVLEVVGEIVAGLPVSKAGSLAIISKSGGFGSREALVEVARSYFGSRAKEREAEGAGARP